MPTSKPSRRRPNPQPMVRVAKVEEDFHTRVPHKIVIPRPERRQRDHLVLEPRLVVKPSRNTLLEFRESQRWVKESAGNTRVAVRAMPFVTREGVISSNAVYYWRCSASQYIASVTSTVYRRLYDRWRRWTKDGDRIIPNRDLALRTAAMYSLTGDSTRLTRVLECAKRNEGAARRMLYKWSRNVDAQTGFWYGQLTSVTSWLQHRSRRPRDKSTNLLADFRIIEISLDNSECHKNQMWLNDLTDFSIRRVTESRMEYLPKLFCPRTEQARRVQPTRAS